MSHASDRVIDRVLKSQLEGAGDEESSLSSPGTSIESFD